MRERMATFPALFNSGIVSRAPLFDALASGPGIGVNCPFLNDITDQPDEVQVEDTPPVNDYAQPGQVQYFPILNRVKKNSSNGLAKQLSGSLPMAAIIDQMVMTRLKNRQITLVSQLRGLFGTSGAANFASALSAVRLGGVAAEPFSENGANAGPEYLIDPDKFIDTSALLGELEDDLKAGCILMHPNVKARLRKLDRLNFRTLVMQSQLPWTIETYCDIPIFVSNRLVRPGGQSGYVYETYLIVKGIIGYGEKPQQGDTTDVASIQYFRDRDTNREIVWDRSRFMLGVNGTSYTGAPANANNGPSNAELTLANAWTLKFQTADRVGCAAIRTNG